MLLEEVVALQLQEAMSEFARMHADDLRHTCLGVVVADAGGHTLEEAEGLNMAILESLRAFPRVAAFRKHMREGVNVFSQGTTTQTK